MTLALLLAGCGPKVFTCEAPFAEHVPDTTNPRLHQEGTRLVQDGREVRLDGVNLGGWLLWEAWIWGRPIDWLHLPRLSEAHMLARLTELYGADAAARFRARLDAELVTDEDLAAIAALGFSSVRLPLNHTVVEDPRRLETVDALLDGAAAHGLRVVLDLHAAPGGQADLFMADPDGVLLWEDPAARARTLEVWRTLAARYADHPAVAGYELLNEPHPGDDAAYVAFLAELVAAVRQEDPRTLIVVEGTSFARDFRAFGRRLDPNMAYAGHLYTSLDGLAHRRVPGLGALQECHDVPVWLGEYGEDDARELTALREAAEGAGLAGASYWTWKKVPVGHPGLARIEAPADWLVLVDDLTAKAGRPATLGEAEAEAALDAFLEAARPSAMTVDEDVARAVGAR